MLFIGWRIGSPELLVVTATTLFFSWLIVGILQSRGKFRILSMLVVCALVAILTSTFVPRMRVAAAHRKLAAAVTKAGGTIQISTEIGDEHNGWYLTSDRIPLPKILKPVYSIIANGEVTHLEIPIDAVNEEILQNVKFSKDFYPSLALSNGERDYRALSLLISKSPLIALRTEHLPSQAASFFSTIRKPLYFRFLGLGGNVDVDPDDVQRALTLKARNLMIGPGVNLVGPSWTKSHFEVVEAQDIFVLNSTIDAGFLRAFADSAFPISIRMHTASLTDAAWIELSELSCIEKLDLESCNPTVAQLRSLGSNKSIKHLAIGEYGLSDENYQELANLYTLESIQIFSNLQPTTLKMLLDNNPSLRTVSTRFEMHKGQNDWQPITVSRNELEKMIEVE